MTRMVKQLLLFLLLYCSSQLAIAADYDGAMDNLFNPSFSSMLTSASKFTQAHSDHSAATACRTDPKCGMPGDSNSGFKLPAGSCCEGSSACIEAFDGYVTKIDSVMYALYKNERTYAVIMRIHQARMGAASGARKQVDFAKAQKGFIEKFNAKTRSNIIKLNNYLLALGGAVDQYCTGSKWYKRNGLPIYQHAKAKFPK